VTFHCNAMFEKLKICEISAWNFGPKTELTYQRINFSRAFFPIHYKKPKICEISAWNFGPETELKELPLAAATIHCLTAWSRVLIEDESWLSPLIVLMQRLNGKPSHNKFHFLLIILNYHTLFSLHYTKPKIC